MNERIGVLSCPEHPRALQTQTGHPVHHAPDAAEADGQAQRPDRAWGNPSQFLSKYQSSTPQTFLLS